MLFILLITGGRFSEVNRMTYDDLIYQDNAIHLPGTKQSHQIELLKCRKVICFILNPLCYITQDVEIILFLIYRTTQFQKCLEKPKANLK